MKRPKDRLHSVAVIGATPAGIAAVNKLGELGIPVTLIDSDIDLDDKLCRDEWRLKSGITFNHAYRPGLMRMLRNPNIRCVLPARVIAIKHSSQGFRLRLDRQQTYVDSAKCTLCGRCTEVCPVLLPGGDKPIRLNSQRSLPGRTAIDKRRQPLCQQDCPLGVNAQGYITLARAGRVVEALQLVRQHNVLPGICGRICTHPCEDACRRGELDEPIAIRDIKRYVADCERTRPQENPLIDVLRRPHKIAVIGSGPAGLAAAADLARLGYPVTVFEKEKMAGGLLRYAIGSHRLPRNILDADLAYIESLGVRFITDHCVQLDQDIDRLKSEFAAVICTTGTWRDRKLGVPGENLKGVEGCLSFLSRFYRAPIKSLEGKTAVIGDGNAAFDLARTLVRLGADVTVLSWFPEDMIPADSEEIRAAREEGINIKTAVKTVEFMGVNGRLDRLRCMPTVPGEPDAQGIPWPVVVVDGQPLEFKFDQAFVAIGLAGDLKPGQKDSDIYISPQGLIEVNDVGHTHPPHLSSVYAAGDCVRGPSSVVEAMAAGRIVARTVHRDISGEQLPDITSTRPESRDYPKISTEIPSLSRATMPERQPSVRKNSFAEVALGLSEQQVVSEAERCLQCGVCSECMQCVDACGAINAIDHEEIGGETLELAGVVIIADSENAPAVKGEDVIRAYGPKAAKTDVDAMVLRGFAAAARATVLLGGGSMRPKGRGLAFSPPDPGLLPQINIGVFVCRCNDALGWLDGMDQYVAGLTSVRDVIHAEVLTSACTPAGSTHIIRTIREKGITRVALASCVCCPLNFICSACTDQRSRLKSSLFTGTGISRSMVESCNLKGEALSLIAHDHFMAMKKFVGLIERSIQRARKLKSLPDPARNYNFNTAVIGVSEAAVNSVLILAEAGLEVFWFSNSNRLVKDVPRHPNIYRLGNATVKELSGTLGNFRISVAMENQEQVLQVGAVILDDLSRKEIQYIHQRGLPGRFVTSEMQRHSVSGVPFFYPGSTFISGLYLADPPGIKVSNRTKGAAAAVQAAAVMPRGPRQNKGYTVVVDEDLCRSCGRCIGVCPSRAITLHPNAIGGWSAWVDEALCKGCGNCISVCPSNAADSRYRDQRFLEQMIETILIQQ
jgi:NADPH-dependent glutamate synthase beta subunit-like oxidoreductase/Pyruvate/2-oxoacid:ferredoxin oxidoreductase delta subunit